jgi:hypothetical protein
MDAQLELHRRAPYPMTAPTMRISTASSRKAAISSQAVRKAAL